MSSPLPENKRLADLIERATIPIRSAKGHDDVPLHVAAWDNVVDTYVPLLRSNAIEVTQDHLDVFEPLVRRMERARSTHDLLWNSTDAVTALSAMPGRETEIYVPHHPKT